ncbi:MAG: ABC transporter substrate-binding protein [Clostridiales bacterium]|nr:ABC transporter substrate-binding protein [Clostridiales bacterium]
MKKKYSAIILAIVLVTVLVLAACGGGGGGSDAPAPTPAPAAGGGGGGGGGGGDLVEKGYQAGMAKDVITIRGVRPQTGGGAIFEQTAFGPQYKMWADMINAEGGLYVKSLDRQVLVDIQTYDDGSDMERTTQLFEQIVASEKPDLIIGPESTARLFACAPIAQRYGYMLLAAEGGAKELENQFEDIRRDYGQVNTFAILSYSETQVPALVKLIDELGVDSVYCAYINDLHGIEYWGATEAALREIGVEIKGSEPVDPDDPQADTVINNAKASGATAFLGYMYPGQSIPLTQAAIRLDYSPDMYLLGPGLCYDFFPVFAFGDHSQQSVTGIMGWGAWNEKSSASAREYSEMFKNYWIGKGEFWLNADGTPNPDGTVFQDWWGHVPYYAAMQILQQAVENAGELNEDGMINNETLITYLNSGATFNTYMHPELRFTNNILMDDMYLGNVGQWQNGVFEVIDADHRRTADPIFPKPPWPADLAN